MTKEEKKAIQKHWTSMLRGKRIEDVQNISGQGWCDAGFTLFLEDGITVRVGFSACEGTTEVNGVNVLG